MPTFFLFLESIGTSELMIIAFVALIVFGPRKLPELGRSLGRSLAEFKRASDDFKRTWEYEVEMERAKERETPGGIEAESRVARSNSLAGWAEDDAASHHAEATQTAAAGADAAQHDGATQQMQHDGATEQPQASGHASASVASASEMPHPPSEMTIPRGAAGHSQAAAAEPQSAQTEDPSLTRKQDWL